MTATSTTGEDVALSDVMLAMDVVDMLRHEDKLVARALNDEARERALIERVRKAYRAQGIDVSDDMIANGVAALKEQEYAYEPAEPGFKTNLLLAWVNRRKLGGGLGVLAALFAIIGGGWYGFVEYPQQRERTKAIAQLNNSTIVQKTDIDELLTRKAQLKTRLDAQLANGPGDAPTNAFEQLTQQAGAGIERAEDALQSAIVLQQNPDLAVDTGLSRQAAFKDSLARQQQSIDRARAELATSTEALDSLQGLAQLPATLRLLRSEALDIAVPATVDNRIEQVYDAASSALNRGEVQQATAGADQLRTLIQALEDTYRLRVVSRPGELSGVIREPPNNRRASNYYLIVEAIDANNRPVTVSIESEEDGSKARVSKWGIRVSEAVFDSIRRDKQDDGIIQNSNAGQKRRGYLDVEYSLVTTGGMIHRWESR
ncbi:MAG: DUF6384 family protein [Woeseiaceae bacterium]